MNNFFVYAVTAQICATLLIYIAIAMKMKIERLAQFENRVESFPVSDQEITSKQANVSSCAWFSLVSF